MSFVGRKCRMGEEGSPVMNRRHDLTVTVLAALLVSAFPGDAVLYLGKK
jgi:hypothetical protein